MPFPANFNLSDLNGKNGFRISGAGAEISGWSVASAGDVNGDGFADVIIGAPRADANGNRSGASYVVFGKASAFGANLDLSSLDGTNGFKISGAKSDEASGSSVASAGEVNGDGFADLIVGAPYADPHGYASGASYVVFGKASGFGANLDLSSLNGTNGFKISGAAGEDHSGYSVASAGDLNGDGLNDIIIGAPGSIVIGDVSGASYVVFGKTSGFGDNLDLSSLNGSNGFKISAAAADNISGFSVASAGDVNRDGFADVIIGAPAADVAGEHSGASYVVFGRASGFDADIDLSSLTGGNGFRISGAARGDYSGRSVASAGDVNGDGFNDIIIGAPPAAAGYVVFGKASGFDANIDLSNLNGGNGFRVSGAAADGRAGWSVAAAGDVNGDGFDDIIIGAPHADANGNQNAGASYVVFGKASGFGANIDLADLDGADGFKISGVANFDYSGSSVAAAGDVNGDGLADLVVGAWTARPNGTYSGASYVIFGLKPDTAVTRTGTVAGQSLVGGDLDDVLKGKGGDDTLWAHGGTDTLKGGEDNDLIHGATGKDTISGNKDHDALDGGVGRDVVKGGRGHDLVAGGKGQDDLLGRAGKDAFLFAELGKKNADRIMDFEADKDMIGLEADTFSAIGGSLGKNEFVVGSQARDGNDHVIYKKKSGKLWYDDDGKGGDDKVLLAEVDKGTDVTHKHFAVEDFLV